MDHTNNYLLSELLDRQLKNLPTSKRLQFSDLKRIANYIQGNIFDVEKCCLWTGYITNNNNTSKGTYINFYHRNKKVALHRLLYINFVGELNDSEYLRFKCKEKGKCCNINHLEKYQYNKPKQINDSSKIQSNNDQRQIKKYDTESSESESDFIVLF